jgi:hypothetical protein
MPILGDVHEDTDTFGSHAKEHWHIDYRFVSRDVYGCFVPNFPSPIEKRDITGTLIWDRSKQLEMHRSQINTADNEIFYKRFRCKRGHTHLDWEDDVYGGDNASFHSIPAFQKMRSAYCGKELILKEGEYFCPHRGTKIDVTNVNEKGEIHCPAHLLKFDKESFKSII